MKPLYTTISLSDAVASMSPEGENLTTFTTEEWSANSVKNTGFEDFFVSTFHNRTQPLAGEESFIPAVASKLFLCISTEYTASGLVGPCQSISGVLTSIVSIT